MTDYERTTDDYDETADDYQSTNEVLMQNWRSTQEVYTKYQP